MSQYLISALLGVVEGFTEFLPISSTGHLILVNEFTNFTGRFANMFDVVIQLGAILSVVVYFWKKIFPFNPSLTKDERNGIWTMWFKAAVAIIPAILIGGLLGSKIEELLFKPTVVAVMLLVGGIFLLYIERKNHHSSINSIAELTYKTAFLIGLIQCLAMVPGTSRSAATIIGAMLLGCSRLVAAEFSFFLAIPTMMAASAYSLLKNGIYMTGNQVLLLAIGFVVSFVVAWIVIAAFMSYITKRDFKPFGYYRIVLGALVLIYFYLIK